MSPANRMVRLPPAAALLALSNIVYLTSAHPFAQPQQTRTAEYHELHVQPWPLAPTAAPGFLDDLLGRRQLNTVCGYIGGDPALPATCSAGSHCVVDVDHSAVGCCPDGGACTQGVYTGCVDGSSGAQAEVNPYVFTCQGSDLCYKNSFEGGYSQYGCGSKSGMATTVVGTASGKSAIDLTTISAPITGTAESSSEPTTRATKKSSSSRTDSSKTATKTSATKTDTTETDTSSTKVSSTKTSTTDTTTTDTSASSSSETTSTASRSTETDGSSSTSSEESSSSSTSAASAPDTDGDDNGSNNTGAIIGGTISGVAALVALIILGVWLWRRKKANQGPGLSQKAQAGENGNIQPLLPMREVDESTAPPPMAMARGGSITPVDDFYDDRRAEPYQPHYPYGYGPGSAAGGVMAVGNNSHQMDLDEEPLTRDRDDREFEDYAEGFHAPLNPIEEESRPNTAAVSDPSDLSNPSSAYPGPRGGGGGPLWQQNRGPGWV